MVQRCQTIISLTNVGCIWVVFTILWVDLMNLGSFTGVRVVNEAFLEAIMMNLCKIEGERGSKQGANKEF